LKAGLCRGYPEHLIGLYTKFIALDYSA